VSGPQERLTIGAAAPPGPLAGASASAADGSEPSDVDLLRWSAAGEREAYDRFVTRHQASVFRFARALVSRPEDAEDVMQQAFLSAWRGAGQFRGEASARTWLLTIARHAAHHLRGHQAREPVSDTPLDELGARAGWGGDDPERLALAAERRDRLVAAFAGLAPADRELLTLRDLEGLSGQEAAAMLGISVTAMKSRLHRARLALAARLATEVSGATRQA
jgi:RNA polymerase sigma-70 factor, ECF subfamily